MEGKFGKVRRETGNFKHFGVHVHRDVDTMHVHASQFEYVLALEAIVVPKGRGETLANSTMITAFRSLVSGVAWAGVTHGGAVAGASLYQGCLPNPTYEDCRHVNAIVEQLKRDYAPMVFRHDLDWNNLRLFVIGDSSLGNAKKYSQGGFSSC